MNDLNTLSIVTQGKQEIQYVIKELELLLKEDISDMTVFETVKQSIQKYNYMYLLQICINNMKMNDFDIIPGINSEDIKEIISRISLKVNYFYIDFIEEHINFYNNHGLILDNIMTEKLLYDFDDIPSYISLNDVINKNIDDIEEFININDIPTMLETIHNFFESVVSIRLYDGEKYNEVKEKFTNYCFKIETTTDFDTNILYSANSHLLLRHLILFRYDHKNNNLNLTKNNYTAYNLDENDVRFMLEDNIENILSLLDIEEDAKEEINYLNQTYIKKESSAICEILQFYSKSKDGTELGPDIVPHWRKILSNFWMVTVSHKGNMFPSVEHFFQASKFKCSNKPECFTDFTVNGKYGNVDALTAKRKGSKTGFKSMGAILDVNKWNMCRVNIMREFIQSRYEQDEVFRQILNACRERGITLLHFERSGKKSFWGGSVSRNDGNIQGENQLGKIMMEIAIGCRQRSKKKVSRKVNKGHKLFAGFDDLD